ncbi:MAG: pyridoxamine 5'-phosphate oxidase family protein [Lachnospiraceae bacterium]|nr:pyridoxamine 5'-phosphate oxidase family protein [Lachnospiraceae bacterium]
MRRKDREITDFEEIISIIRRCDVCRVALNDGDYPYIVPLNFGMTAENGRVVLYFHSAKVGTKLDLIRKDSRASFEMDCGHKLITDSEAGSCTMNYESVIGKGIIEFVPDAEKLEALKILMAHYHQENFPFNENVIPQTAVFKLTVSELSGKRREKKN